MLGPGPDCRRHRRRTHRLKIGFLPQARREGFESLSRVILSSVEAPIDEALDKAAQGVEQGRDGQGGGNDREG